jgi:hypothetical protein
MTLITTSTSKVRSAHPHPDIESLTIADFSSESRALQNALVKASATRHQGKCDGSFHLQFVTATDAAYFKNGDARRSLHLGVMEYCRSKQNKKKDASRKPPETLSTTLHWTSCRRTGLRTFRQNYLPRSQLLVYTKSLSGMYTSSELAPAHQQERRRA